MSNTLWFGFLEAGAKSSPVVMDSKLSTGNEATLYLFNQNRNAIIEYRRDIVETKLRTLKPEEGTLEKALSQAYKKALAGFAPRSAQSLNIPEHSPAPPSRSQAPAEDIDIDDEFEIEDFDDDIPEEDED